MRLLLDTHLLLWFSAGSHRLSSRAREMIADSGNQVFYSVASLWEIAIKSARERKDFAVDPTALRKALQDNDFQELCVLAHHALYTARLPAIHRDPFDRMLVAQALEENLILLTADFVVASYSAAIVRV